MVVGGSAESNGILLPLLVKEETAQKQQWLVLYTERSNECVAPSALFERDLCSVIGYCNCTVVLSSGAFLQTLLLQEQIPIEAHLKEVCVITGVLIVIVFLILHLQRTVMAYFVVTFSYFDLENVSLCILVCSGFSFCSCGATV